LFGIVEQPKSCSNINCNRIGPNHMHHVKIGQVVVPICHKCAEEVRREIHILQEEIRHEINKL
jgi:hypothetical protein